MRILSITKQCLCVTTALAMSGCVTNSWHSRIAENDCDPVVYELDGFGKNRGEALNDAANSAIAQEFGAYLTSEVVLEGDELIVNRQGQATRGTLDSAIAISAPVVATDGSVTLRTRVTLCRNSIQPDARTRPPQLNANGDLLARTQARIDLTRSQTSAHRQKTKEFHRALAALLNPATGPQLHEARVISNDSTHVSSLPRRNSQTGSRRDGARHESVVFEVAVGIDLDPQVRKALEQQLDNVSVGYHSSSRFVNSFKQLNNNPGLAIIDRRFEHLDNKALHPSDRQYVSSKPRTGGSTDNIVDVTVLKGIIETTTEDATFLNKQVNAAVEAFYENGLSLIALSRVKQTIIEVPLFDSGSYMTARINKIALYPQNHKGKIRRANGVVFDSPTLNEKRWLSRRVSPLTMLAAQKKNGKRYPALNRGGIRLEISLSIPGELATQISQFKVRATHNTENVIHTGFKR